MISKPSSTVASSIVGAHPYLHERNRILWILLGLLFVVYVVFEYDRIGDFLVYYQASKDLVAYKNIYKELYGMENALPYFSGPTLSLLLVPFTFFSFPVAAAAWKIASLFFLYRIWINIESYFNLGALSLKEYRLFVVLSFLSVSYTIYRNFLLCQITLFLLFCILEAVRYIFQKDKQVLGAVFLSLGVACKILPIVILPYLLYRKKWLGSFYMVLFLVCWMLLPSIFLGWGHQLFLLKQWWVSANPTNEMNAFDVYTEDTHGIPALISTLFVDKVGFNENTLQISRHLIDLSPNLVRQLILAAQLFFVFLTLFFLRTLPFKEETRPKWQLWELGYILMATPILFPQQRQYNFFFLFPSIAYLTYSFLMLNQQWVVKKEKKPVLFYVYLFGVIIFNLELILGQFREYYWHYKTLTYGVFVILFVYARITPEMGSNEKSTSA